jgi:hypothetical protein
MQHFYLALFLTPQVLQYGCISESTTFNFYFDHRHKDKDFREPSQGTECHISQSLVKTLLLMLFFS